MIQGIAMFPILATELENPMAVVLQFIGYSSPVQIYITLNAELVNILAMKTPINSLSETKYITKNPTADPM